MEATTLLSGPLATASIVLSEQVAIPSSLETIEDFRRWATSDSFPEDGRVDYISGNIEVDMSPEDLYCHGGLKVELIRVLSEHVRRGNLGEIYTDRTRFSTPAADVSAEPDLLFVSNDSLDKGIVRLVPKTSGKKGRYIEFEGAPDLVIEIVSDSSVGKDTRRLPAAYFAAEIKEFWLADGRQEELVFHIYNRGKIQFEHLSVDLDGFQRSAVFNCGFQLRRRINARGNWVYELLIRS
jgi:Uma2 family endonuclease